MATIVENPGATTRPADVTSGNKTLIGIAFPYRKEGGEFPKRVFNTDAVKNDLTLLFDTPLGSRRMRPLFGSNKEVLVFESTGPLLVARLSRNIRQTIFLNEPRVRVLAIAVQEKKSLVVAQILYIIQGVQDTITLEIERPTVAA
jgi:phage baseplate assembly protein W